VQALENQRTNLGSSHSSNEHGANDINILFSCTWKLAKKKESEQDIVPHNTIFQWASLLPFLSSTSSHFIPTMKSAILDGVIIIKVNTKARSGCIDESMRLLMEIGFVLSAHWHDADICKIVRNKIKLQFCG